MCYNVLTMYIDVCKYKRGDKNYKRTLLRRGYRREGKVKHETIANLSHLPDEEIEALRIALKMKGDLVALKNFAEGKFKSGKMVGAVAALYQVANRLGITNALGPGRNARLVLWLILARLIDQGSRLSAVRLAKNHTACEILGLEPFTEDDLYAAMDWLYENQEKIEEKLFRSREGKSSNLFLYDVSSSYVEGEKNELADWGYNRDGKKGKKQVVYGLLTDEEGEPIAIEVFRGNTKDNETVQNQITRLKERFGCKHFTIVGDKGMIKSAQIEQILGEELHFITSITKGQIRSLLHEGILQLEFFEETLCEVEDSENGVRYILRRNPRRAGEIKKGRESKIQSIGKKVEKANLYLREHPRAKAETQVKNLNEYVKKLRMDKMVRVEFDDRLNLQVDESAIAEAGSLDGCYVIKTDLPVVVAGKELVHRRYKSLSEVEWGFRTAKTGYLEARPIYVRKAGRTSAHLFVVMLAYKIERYLRSAWSDLNMTVEEGVSTLSSITSSIIIIGEKKVVRVPVPDKRCCALLERIEVTLPKVLPYLEADVATRKKLQKHRKG